MLHLWRLGLLTSGFSHLVRSSWIIISPAHVSPRYPIREDPGSGGGVNCIIFIKQENVWGGPLELVDHTLVGLMAHWSTLLISVLGCFSCISVISNIWVLLNCNLIQSYPHRCVVSCKSKRHKRESHSSSRSNVCHIVISFILYIILILIGAREVSIVWWVVWSDHLYYHSQPVWSVSASCK